MDPCAVLHLWVVDCACTFVACQRRRNFEEHSIKWCNVRKCMNKRSHEFYGASARTLGDVHVICSVHCFIHYIRSERTSGYRDINRRTYIPKTILKEIHVCAPSLGTRENRIHVLER
ncbi:hypothetical protein CC86DRAFT_37010 [Ophiobolus disseminans]|uniref:Uncharacterized protein n=1 Tax=Ophiobolus disseminans TaxID=1469910 RepID=A0A6A6ZZ59_9PLEO|nr:hypothetical protein CC86DRAFT_37010 [Ophiobolus disseminans]